MRTISFHSQPFQKQHLQNNCCVTTERHLAAEHQMLSFLYILCCVKQHVAFYAPLLKPAFSNALTISGTFGILPVSSLEKINFSSTYTSKAPVLANDWT
mmetsp:Transcript_1816/g.4540  ORF Transcript_1816/g.4540 Transcript_1816/m.4540 type:complete len:99 (-) Transcript_1816:520-816(-)